MKERICYLCEEPISFENCKDTNPLIPNLVKQWESDITEFYCCHCKRLIDTIIDGPSDLYALLDWARNGRLTKLKQLGILCKEDLIELERLR